MVRLYRSLLVVILAVALLPASIIAPAYAASAEAEAPKSDVTKSTAPLADEDTPGTAKKADGDARPKAPGCSQANIKNPGFGCDKSR